MTTLTPGTKVKFVVPRSSKSYAKMNHHATVIKPELDKLIIEFADGTRYAVDAWQLQTPDAQEGPKCRTST